MNRPCGVGSPLLSDLHSLPIEWETFLKAHWGAIAATDFFSVEVITRSGLIRYFVLFVIDLKTRRVEIAGILPRPNGEWMKQIARMFTQSFREILKSSGIKTVKLPARSPNLNAYAERFVRSIKSECLSRIIPLGERHLRLVVKEYTDHYHVERNHQGLHNRLIEDRHGVVYIHSAVVRHERLGGFLDYYERRAA
jgi:putative transposase